MCNVYEYINEPVSSISSIDTAVIVAVISGAVAVIGLIVNSIMSYRTKRMEYRYSEIREKQQELREKQEKMIDPYNKLVNLIFEILNLTKQNKTINDIDLIRKMAEFNVAVLLYGSNEVISKWGNYRVNMANPEGLDPSKSMLKLEEVLYVIREDLGFSKKEMSEGDILSLFINDPESLTGRQRTN